MKLFPSIVLSHTKVAYFLKCYIPSDILSKLCVNKPKMVHYISTSYLGKVEIPH